jgi:hypothetical protein
MYVEYYFRLATVWSDADLIEVRAEIRFQEWSGEDRAYAARDLLRAFAEALEGVEAGGSDAALEVGQPELGYANVRLREYDRARHLRLDAEVGRGAHVGHEPRFAARSVRLSAPVERGPLQQFAVALRTLVDRERGEAMLALPTDWP